MVQPGKILAFQANDPGSNPGGRTKSLLEPFAADFPDPIDAQIGRKRRRMMRRTYEEITAAAAFLVEAV